MAVLLTGEAQNSLLPLLLKRRLLSPTQAELALQIQKRKGEPLEDIIVRMGWVDEVEINKLVGELWDIPVFGEGHLARLEEKLLELVPESLSRKHVFLPLWRQEGQIWVAMSDPFDLVAIDDLQRLTKHQVKPILATAERVLAAIDEVYKKKAAREKEQEGLAGQEQELQNQLDVKEDLLEEMSDFKLELDESRPDDEDEEDANQLRIHAGDPPVVKMVNFVLVRAISDKASDIHVEPKEDGIQVRYRIDGSLFDLISAPKRLKSSILSRLKILSGMDIAVKRVPQDGSFSIHLDQQEVDFRVNSLPTIYGEKIVLRLLEKNAVLKNKLADLGLGEQLEALFRKYIYRPHGMILVTGPTGSGKSTTLYTILNEIKSPHKNIITVEDPAEYRLPGIQQVQVKPDIGFDFADALRAILRQDPDIIMIGEIRDMETAQIAVKSSLTGHLVLSTLHTNDAPGAIVRLINIGIDSFLVASSVTLAIAQRLVKRICNACKEKYAASAEEKEIMGINKSERVFLYRGKGCSKCRNTGYSGRLAVFEVFEMSAEIKRILLEKSGMDEIRGKAIEQGMETLKACGFRRALEGVTSLQEVLATCIEER